MIFSQVQTPELANWYGRRLLKRDGFWCPERQLRPILSTQKHFKAKDTDLILSTLPRSGATWLKALTFSIANRDVYTFDQSPLLTSNPHTLVPSFENYIYFDSERPDLETIPSPRIFTTHVPFGSLPNSIKESECRIIYVYRNPLDQFISHRKFWLESKMEEDGVVFLEIDEAFDLFCLGIHPYGPFCDHVLGYGKASLKNPEKVLFLKYEDLNSDALYNVKRIAEFMGFPFSDEEEKQGQTVEEILKLCDLENISNLEVNKNGIYRGGIKNSVFFREGEVGDWRNYMSPTMAARFQIIMEKMFEGSGLMFKII